MDRYIVAAAALVTAVAYTQLFIGPYVLGLELTNLFFYMDVWPTVLAASGYALAYLLSKIFNINKPNKAVPFMGLVSSAAIIGYWHLPLNSFFGFGVCPADLNTPILYHLRRVSYIVVGVMLYVSVRTISKPWREALAIAAGKVMGWYGFYLTLLDNPIYVAPPVIFSTSLHHEAGVAMLLTMIFLDFAAVISLVNHYFKGKITSTYPLPN